MTATISRKPRTVNPARCDLVTLRRMAYPCELLPAGQPAHVVLNGKPYVVTADGSDAFTFHGERGRSHTVCGGTCCCEDFIYVREARGEACKHVLALGKLRADGSV